VVTTPVSSTETPDPKTNHREFIDIIQRDNALPIPPTSYVPQNTPPTKKVSITLSEGEVYIGEGVLFKGFTVNGQIPGPTIIVDEGDVVEFTVVNSGKIPHGASIHAAYTQTSKYLGKIEAGATKTMVFKVNTPGVYMYHCAPGGHAIPMHIIFGQYGMMVVNPKKQYKLEQLLHKKPDVDIYLVQHELYASGKDAINSQPVYTMFNGKLFRYVVEPIKARPGDYVRINFLNAGPNLLSTFHIVGIIWDFVYWQGNPDAVMAGGQTVTAGPADSWVIEFRMPPDEGAYTMLTHAVGSTDRGAIGLLVCDDSANTPVTIMSDGPKYSETEFADIKSKITRVVSPFEPGSPDVDIPKVYGPETKEVIIKIIGNSYDPKVVQVSPGTKVTWVNEDVFTYMEGEFGGIHNVSTYEAAPESFSSKLLAHTEKFTMEFTKEGEYKYMCTPHPYMRGVLTVKNIGGLSGTSDIAMGFLGTILFLVVLSMVFQVYSRKKSSK
jgi:nitrite reductase (NO-forming)